ncbi:unnamed protein product [Diplocarpon coronariae]
MYIRRHRGRERGQCRNVSPAENDRGWQDPASEKANHARDVVGTSLSLGIGDAVARRTSHGRIRRGLVMREDAWWDISMTLGIRRLAGDISITL